MSDIKGQHLYVNLGASQVRRWLKGFGNGVRKVQSAGKHQAVIIHTATGQHLHELEKLFGDVMPASLDDRRSNQSALTKANQTPDIE
jgi:DNA transformation protein and related proteins